MNRTVVKALVVLLTAGVTLALSYEHEWPIITYSGSGTFGNQGRKIVHVLSGTTDQDRLHLIFSITGGPTKYTRSTDGGATWDDPPLDVPWGYTPWCNEYPSIQVDASVDRPWTPHEESGWEHYGMYCAVLRTREPQPDWAVVGVAGPSYSELYQHSLALSESPWVADPSMGYLVTTRDEYNPESDRFVSKLYFFAFDTLYPIPLEWHRC